MNRRWLAAILIAACFALPIEAQKGPSDALGFNANRVYDLNDLDSVNLFNGNLTISIPLGVRYQVSSLLSYQFVLNYNSKIWDYETWPCQDLQGNMTTCDIMHSNWRSNAGVGWRVSFGRLISPYEPTTRHDDSLWESNWIYEGPAGDEHPLGRDSTAVIQANVADHIRMHFNAGDNSREIEFGSGEIHRFEFEHGSWRLKQIRDRFNNQVNFSYDYSSDDRELQWHITDTVGRTHTVTLTYWAGAADGWSLGQNITSLDLQAYNNGRATYMFGYSSTGWPGCNVTPVPNLTHVDLPDGSSFLFDYLNSGTCNSTGIVNKVTYPTGAVVSYEWGGFYQLAAPGTVCTDASTYGIKKRTLKDGRGTYQWDYSQKPGPPVDITANLNDICGTGFNPTSGSSYWARTSVIEPADDSSHRVRTDHYFSTISEGPSEGGVLLYNITHPLPSFGFGIHSYASPGAVGVPPSSLRKSLQPVGSGYPGDVDGADQLITASSRRLLATETYAGCDLSGDCSNGTLLRQVSNAWLVDNTTRLLSTRTSYSDDNGCTGPCYAQTTNSDDNGANQFRTTTRESNFPNTTTSISTVQYPTWSAADLTNPAKVWLFNTYSEKSRTEGSSSERETFCFDADHGVLLRHRVLGGATPAANDLLSVFSYESHGNVEYQQDYGGDVQTLGTGSDLCSVSIPSTPWYKVKNVYLNPAGDYAGGVVTKSSYFDRSSGQQLAFLSLDRTVDRWTGVVTADRDTSGVGATYSYDPLPARLHSVTVPSGTTTASAANAVTSYSYTNAVGAADGTWSAAKVNTTTTASDGGSLAGQFRYDGMGRLIQSASLGPSSWTATETFYDAEGRVGWISEPESTGTAAPTGWLTASNKTTYAYDAFGRVVGTTTPDLKTATVAYLGERQRTRSSPMFIGGTGDTNIAVVENYDGMGRLVGVTQMSGPTTSLATTGANVQTSYSYDVSNRLLAVKMGRADGTGPLQNRLFNYDGRGFLRWESQPESGIASYQFDPRGHVISKTQSAANSQFDLSSTYDSAERLREVDARNPLYPAPDQQPFRIMKSFEYEDAANDLDSPKNYRLGKLTKAARYNYGETALEPVYKVEDTFKYLDWGGRKTDRNTTISQISYGYTNVLKSIDMSQRYDALGQVSTIKYPMCSGCGAPPTDPDRSNMTRSYTGGRLKSLSGYITDITYWPNGLRNELKHTNGISDVQDVTNMHRPSSLKFETYDRCVRPTITSQPTGGQVASSGGAFVLTVAASGTASFQYQWRDVTHGGPDVGTTASITVNPTETTEYYVTVSNPCGFEQSESAKVTIAACATPSTGTIAVVAQPDGSWILKPNPEARAGRTFSWWKLPDLATVVGTSETLAVGVLAQTTTFRFTVSDSCGTATSDVTIGIPIPMTVGLQANAASTTSVSLSWPIIPGAVQYTVQRRSQGGPWAPVITQSARTYSDSGLTSSRTYVYRVLSDNGGSTDFAVATTMQLTAAAANQFITPAPFNDMLTAVNKVREAVGWPAVTWSNVLAPNDPLPAPDQYILAKHVMSCRARMNEALQALGVRVQEYSVPDLFNQPISATSINEVQQRAHVMQ
jgi:YD repeat-containing protein